MAVTRIGSQVTQIRYHDRWESAHVTSLFLITSERLNANTKQIFEKKKLLYRHHNEQIIFDVTSIFFYVTII